MDVLAVDEALDKSAAEPDLPGHGKARVSAREGLALQVLRNET